MGIIGYFPATMVKETHTFVQDTVKIPATVSVFSLHFFGVGGGQQLTIFHFILSSFRRWTSTVVKVWQAKGSLFIRFCF